MSFGKTQENENQPVPAQAAANQQDIIAAVLAALGPILDRVALTPDKIEAIKKPYVDPVEAGRISRERKEMARDIARGLVELKLAQDHCPHGHGGPGGVSYTDLISLEYNHPDGRVRGRCNMCQKFIQPAHYEIASDGNPFVIKA